MALFCDFENVALGVRDTQHEKFDIKLVLERLLLKGSIVVKKAYCDWERYKGFKATMHEANFELIEIPHVRQSGKNSADIRLVVDALDLCYTKAHVNTFVIISGDSDFSPLVSKLRENNKQVIGVGVKQSTSDLLTANCDEFIFYDDLVRESGRQSVRREARPPAAAARKSAASSGNPDDDRRRDEAEGRRTKAVDLAVQTFDALYAERGDGGKIWASVLKEAIKRRKPDFSESYYGFRSFGGLLEEAQSRGFLEMGRDEKSNAYVFRNSSSAVTGSAHQGTSGHDAPSVAGAALASAPAAPEVLPVVHRAGEAEPRERGRGSRSRGGRRGNPDRHEFEPTLSVDTAAALPAADTAQESDDAAERFADAARESQAFRDAETGPEILADERVADADTYEVAPDATAESSAREPGSRRGGRGNRGGRGRDSGARSNAGSRNASAPAPTPSAEAESARVQAPAPAPAPAPASAPAATAAKPEPAAAPVPRAKTARARSPARKTGSPSAARSMESASNAPAPGDAVATKPAARPRRARKTTGPAGDA
jgi:uncharacterized LabA/DUF88 family protein